MLYQIEITTHCNFECFYCAGRDMPQRHMGWDKFERILADIPSGTHVVSLQGEGEPTTHPRFWDMVDAVRARGLTPYTITNGSHVDAGRFAAAFPRIGVSIDTLDAGEAHRIGRYKLDRVLRNLDALHDSMGPGRIHIMTVDYGQPLGELQAFVRTRGYSHGVQPLQTKDDYARRYRDRIDARPPQYTYRCRFLDQPLRRFYDIEGREYPCCYIKDASRHEPIAAMQAKMAAHQVPDACTGCREILTPDSTPRARAAEAPSISFITFCKQRLAHLKQSLPLLAAQQQAEVIVVDYDCPEAAGDWVALNFPAVRVVRERHAPVYNAARAHNLGGRVARGDWLCFVDADSLLAPQFAAQVLPQLRQGAFYTLASTQPDTVGTIICRREDYLAIEGYDEVLQGWGGEDRDFPARLALLGRRHEKLSGAWGSKIAHDTETRMRHHEIKDQWLNQRINALYVQIKYDLTRQFGSVNLPLDARRSLYAQVRELLVRAARTGQPAARLEFTLPAELVVRLFGWRLKRTWTYLLEADSPPPAADTGGAAAQAAGVAAAATNRDAG